MNLGISESIKVNFGISEAVRVNLGILVKQLK